MKRDFIHTCTHWFILLGDIFFLLQRGGRVFLLWRQAVYTADCFDVRLLLNVGNYLRPPAHTTLLFFARSTISEAFASSTILWFCIDLQMCSFNFIYSPRAIKVSSFVGQGFCQWDNDFFKKSSIDPTLFSPNISFHSVGKNGWGQGMSDEWELCLS